MIFRRDLKPQVLLSTLWIFILFNMTFRDLHQFGKASFIQEIMSGVVNGIEITDELMLFGGLIVEIPIIMILLSRILTDKLNKWTNIVASVLTWLILVSAVPSADLDDLFFLGIETITFIFIGKTAWKLR